ncbi:MAG TPA: hypothetical protein VHY22_10365 [Chthoniobacteraceae bacterium]|jgi:hypothetical protein|nr:hypothetical protein [Chthoniobacteraceae bacterium]
MIRRCLAALLLASSAPAAVVQPVPQTAGLIRNPASGWVLYMETFSRKTFDPAAVYWKRMDAAAGFASILYIRCTWAQMEPGEGAYAWDRDPNFQALIAGAASRGLRLAFRIVTNSKDCVVPATPDWVRAAGAQGYMETGPGKNGAPVWTPSVSDPVFRRKLEAFVAAFGRKFDDPSRVDFVDGVGLGWWGEMHHADNPGTQNREVLDWICHTYSNAFHHVLLGCQVDAPLDDFGKDDDIPFGKYGYVARIDSVGSYWFTPDKRQMVLAMFPKIPFFAESGIYSGKFKGAYPPKTPEAAHSLLQGVYDDAIAFHANTLDLRVPDIADKWLKFAPDLVAGFLAHGGYRLYPSLIEFPDRFAASQPVIVKHTWRNLGAGFMANDNVRWGGKYRVAFALIDPRTNAVVSEMIDPKADPGTWIAGQDWPNQCTGSFLPRPAPGFYRFAVGIVNTQDGNRPEIHLAVANLPPMSNWTPLGNVGVTAQ